MNYLGRDRINYLYFPNTIADLATVEKMTLDSPECNLKRYSVTSPIGCGDTLKIEVEIDCYAGEGRNLMTLLNGVDEVIYQEHLKVV